MTTAHNDVFLRHNWSGPGRYLLSGSLPVTSISNIVLKQAAHAAWLFSTGKNAEDIARSLGCNKRTASRRLALAVEQKWLDRWPAFHADQVPEAYRPTMPSRAVQTDLTRATRDWEHTVEINLLPGSRQDYHTAAAGVVGALLRKSHVIGVTWGRTLNWVIDELKSTERVRGATRQARVIPLCPEPMALFDGERQTDLSSTSLAQTLQALIAPQMNEKLPHLTGIPACFPTNLSRRFQSREVRAVFQELSVDYMRIFGPDRDAPDNGRSLKGQGSLVSLMDLVLTGGGIIDDGPQSRRTGTFIRERLSLERDESGRSKLLDELRAAVVGDLAGLLIPRDGISTRQQKLVHDLNRGWLGVTEEHLHDCVQRCHASGAPGVVLFATGRKGPLIREVVRRGLVSRVVIDEECARSIAELKD